MDTLNIELSIIQDEYKLNMLSLEHNIFYNNIDNNTILNESSAGEKIKYVFTKIKIKLDEMLNYLKKIFGEFRIKIRKMIAKIKMFFNKKKKEFQTVSGGTAEINPNEVFSSSLYNTNKINEDIETKNKMHRENLEIIKQTSRKMRNLSSPTEINNFVEEFKNSKDYENIMAGTKNNYELFDKEKKDITGQEYIDYVDRCIKILEKMDKFSEQIKNEDEKIINEDRYYIQGILDESDHKRFLNDPKFTADDFIKSSLKQFKILEFLNYGSKVIHLITVFCASFRLNSIFTSWNSDTFKMK